MPQTAKEGLLNQITRAFARQDLAGLTPVVLVHTPEIRPALRALLKESDLSGRAVLSADELRPNLDVLVVGEVESSALLGVNPS